MDFANDWTGEWRREARILGARGGRKIRRQRPGCIDRVNARLSKRAHPRFKLTAEPFSIDNEMLTPSMKIRRHIIKRRYSEDLEALYGG